MYNMFYTPCNKGVLPLQILNKNVMKLLFFCDFFPRVKKINETTFQVKISVSAEFFSNVTENVPLACEQK